MFSTVVTPQLDRPAGLVFASDIPWVTATAGAENPVRCDVNYFGKPLAISGRVYPKGLWTHAYPDVTPADTVYDVAAKNFELFKADVGLDDASGGGSVQFQILADGMLKAESPVLGPRQFHSLRVSIAGARQVTLRVINGGDGYNCDHAVWGAARFVESGVEDPVAKTP
jgi:alpha-galactosidase